MCSMARVLGPVHVARMRVHARSAQATHCAARTAKHMPRHATEHRTPCSHKKKRMKQIKKMAQRGLLDPESEDPFSLFVASTNIRYCYYADTHKILGNTFGMCVLQVRRTPLRLVVAALAVAAGLTTLRWYAGL